MSARNTEWWVNRYGTQAGVEGYMTTYKPILGEVVTTYEVDQLLTACAQSRSFPQVNTPVLDGFCGNGRHARVMTHLGYRNLIAFDYSEVMLMRARASYTEKVSSDKPTFKKEDARSLTVDSNSRQLYYVLGNSALGFFDDLSDDLRVAKEAHRVLKQGGVFAFDLTDYDYAKSELVQHKTLAKEGKTIVVRERVQTSNKGVLRIGHSEYRLIGKPEAGPELVDLPDRQPRILTTPTVTQLYVPDGIPGKGYRFSYNPEAIDIQTIGRWVYTTEQVIEVLRLAGFQIVDINPGVFKYNSEPAEFGTMGNRNLFIAKKQ